MAQESSFDIVSKVDLQTLDDVVNVAMREIDNRFDFKGFHIKIELNRNEKKITFHAPSEYQIKQVREILYQKMIKRGLSSKVLGNTQREDAVGGSIREVDTIVTGVESELAKKIVKDIKELKSKVNVAIQGEQLRVSGKSKDDLQTVIQFVKEKDYPIPLQFSNFR